MGKHTRILCMLLTVLLAVCLLPVTAAEAEANNVSLTVTAPEVGALPRYDAAVPAGWSSYVSRVVWSGALDQYGRFQPGESYTVAVTTRVDPTQGFFSFEKNAQHLINGQTAKCTALAADKREITVQYTFPALTGAAAPAPAGTPVDSFQPGDYGTVYIPGSQIAYIYMAPVQGAEIFKFESGVTLTVICANVKDNWCALLYEGNLVYLEDSTAFTDRVKYGTTPVEQYGSPFRTDEQVAGGQPITEVKDMTVDLALDRMPTAVDKNKKDDHMFQVTDISWNSDGFPEPFSWAKVVVTCTAKPGYYFAHNAKVTRSYMYKNVPQFLEYIDSSTVKLTYYQWVDGSSVDQGVTEAMEIYNLTHPVADPFYYPTHGSAKLYNPTNDNSAAWRLYEYPSCSHYLKGTLMNTTGVIQILDWDLTDDIPNMTGDWCRISYARKVGFVPKAILTDVVLSDFWEGAPMEIKHADYSFAGGSGTEADPFLIATADQLNAVRLNLKAHYKLVADIDLSKWGNWVPIGATPALGCGINKFNKAQFGGGAFTGSFDGDGHVVSGMTIRISREAPYLQEKSSDQFFGLFGIMGQAVIKNLGIINHRIEISYSAVSEEVTIWGGAFAGWINNVDMTNCYSAGGTTVINVQSAPGTDPTISIEVGGLASQVSGGPLDKFPLGKMHRCYNASDITVTCNNPGYVVSGGLCATTIETCFTECFNTGDISLPVGDRSTFWRDSFAGGLVGDVQPQGIANNMGKPITQTCSIQNSYNAGSVKAAAVGGLYGTSTRSACYLVNCYNVGRLTCSSYPLDGYSMEAKSNTTIPTAPCNNSTYITNATGNGNGVSGDLWQKSAKLGRMVLKAIPEDGVRMPDNKPVNPFGDVPEKEYYFEPVLWAVEKKITAGTSATTFSPEQTCTRAQILTFLWRAVGSPKAEIVSPFSDVKTSDYYYDAAIWAYQKGMVAGGKFAAETPCTRMDTVTYMWKNAGAPGGIVYGSFLDLPAAPEAAEAVGWAVANGVTMGTSPTTFSPKDTCTRGQIVTFLYRALK